MAVTRAKKQQPQRPVTTKPPTTSSIAVPPSSNTPTLPFPTPTAFSSFLATHHTTLPALHLKLAKKSSGIPSITAAEAVEVALCYGWIDGRANSIDDKWWTVRYTPRRPKSIWSAKNVRTCERLIGEGKMQEAGMREVERAKGDGRWERAYEGPRGMEVPEDFERVLEEEGHESARAFFGELNRSERYAVLWRVETASPAARAGRIRALVEGLAVGVVPGEKGTGKRAKEVPVAKNQNVATTTKIKKRASKGS